MIKMTAMNREQEDHLDRLMMIIGPALALAAYYVGL